MKSIDEILEGYKDSSDLIDILGEVQENYGYLSEENMRRIEQVMKIPLVDIYGVATFYASFKLVPKGRHLIKLCKGTACHVKKADALESKIEDVLHIKDRETTADGLFSLECVNCIGACAKAPNMMVDEKVFGELSKDKVEKIIKETK